MTTNTKKARACAGGFTLVELLVSVAILTFLLVLLSSLVSAVSRTWTTGDQQAETFQSGRAILDLIARDVSQALISPRLQFIQNPGNLNSLLTQSPSVTGNQQVANSDAIFFQTVSPRDPLGNVGEVGYYLTQHRDAVQVTHYELRRLFVPPTDPSQPPGTIQTNPAYHINDSPTKVTYNTTANSTLPAWLNLNGTGFSHGTETDFEYFSSVVSDGVVALWIRCIDANGDPIPWLLNADSSTDPIKFNSTAYFQPSIPGQANSFKYTSPTATAQANLLPSSIEITIATVDSPTIARKAVIPGVPPSSDETQIPNAIIAMNSSLIANKVRAVRTFTTTVPLQNALR